MNTILSIKTDDSISYDEIKEIVEQYPANLQPVVIKAFREAEKENFKKAEELCCDLLDQKAVPGVRMLLGTCHFMQNHMQAARQVFSDLATEYPEQEEYLIYLGMTDHALGRYAEAAAELEKLYPLKLYHPFYYTCYGDSLMQLGRLKQSRDVFRKEIEYYEETKHIPSAIMLDGAFQNLIYLDITLGNGKYPEDIKVYYDFLEQAEMTEEMQECLAGNITYFSRLMSNIWYRPLFLEFITHIREKGVLSAERTLNVLEDAFIAWESYAIHDDRQITSMMETYLAADFERRHSADHLNLKEEHADAEIVALTYEWYMCQYIPEHMEEVQYVEAVYPHTYAKNKDFFDNVKNNPIDTVEKIEDKLNTYTKGASRQEFYESMHRAYKMACESKKEPVYVYDGTESYRRIVPKVGRNDPCPCGSGKKYKKCCGR